jgi:DNA-binding NarL/FixJ family response regulator
VTVCDLRPEPLQTAVVCHPERLIAAATAAALRSSGAVRSTATVPSLTRLLSGLHRGVDVAVVFDAVGDDIPELFEALRHRGLSTPVLILSASSTPEVTAQALEWGAAGVLPLVCPVDELCHGVAAAHAGNAVFPGEQRREVLDALRARRLQRYQARRRLAQLSRSERRVLRSLADGTSITAIAAHMSISPHTVRSYVHTLGTKLDARGQLRLAAAGRDLLAAARSTGWEPAAYPGLDESGPRAALSGPRISS